MTDLPAGGGPTATTAGARAPTDRRAPAAGGGGVGGVGGVGGGIGSSGGTSNNRGSGGGGGSAGGGGRTIGDSGDSGRAVHITSRRHREGRDGGRSGGVPIGGNGASSGLGGVSPDDGRRNRALLPPPGADPGLLGTRSPPHGHEVVDEEDDDEDDGEDVEESGYSGSDVPDRPSTPDTEELRRLIRGRGGRRAGSPAGGDLASGSGADPGSPDRGRGGGANGRPVDSRRTMSESSVPGGGGAVGAENGRPAQFLREYEPDLKTAMVTGASGVLGMAVTRMLLSENFRVVIHDSSVDALNDFVAELGSAAKRDVCYPICFDPSNSEAVAAAVARIDADAWPVYVLINNSGILSNTLVEETSIDEWRNVFAQNVDSAFLLSRALLPAMRKRKWGRIVNTCSLAGKTGGVTTGVAYSTTKGALQTLTFALARESAKDGITVNGIAPAYIRTPTVETYPEDVVDMLLRYIPVSRFCEPEEFAHVVRFLISPMSGFITGEIIDQNGGLHMS